MAEVYRLIHPAKYYNDFISQKIRPDGRQFNEFRPMVVNLKSIKAADASAVVKCGNTTVICGIKLELAMPKAETPDCGYVVTNVEISPLCSSKFRPGPPSDTAQACSKLVSDILTASECIDLKSLGIVTEKLAWVLYCDIMCVDYDGCIVDTCLSALLASLKMVTLPKVMYDVDTEECTVFEESRCPLILNGLPLSASFGLYSSDVMISDPSADEEELCGGLGSNLTIAWCNGQLCGMYKLGGNTITSEMQDNALLLARQRTELISKSIKTAINNVK